MPPPGGSITMLEQFWTWFAGLPTWARAVAWFFLWPALAAAKLFGVTSWSAEVRYGTSAAMLIVGGFVWTGALTGALSDPKPGTVTAEPAAEEADEAAAADADVSDTEVRDEEVDDPVVDESSDPDAALTAVVAEVCSEATTADDTLAGRSALREGAADAARFTEFTAREVRLAATEACGERIEALGVAAAPEPKTSADADDADPQVELEGAGWTVFNVVDGDTIDVRAADGSEERVRIIGIDTPERGQCGFGPATSAMGDLVDGREVVLVGGARDDRDRYDRILRYVEVDGTDAGLELIKAGLAIARYDSRDGYGKHPREDAYVAADAAATDISCEPEPEPEPTKAPEPKPSPTATAEPAPKPEPPSSVYYKNCTAAREAGAAPVYRGDPGYAKHLDRDGDGIGCE